MTAILGNYSLVAALLVSLAGLFAALAAARFDSERLLGATRGAIGLVAGLLTVSCVALLAAFFQDNFALAYVAQFSERTLPSVYKLSAFWAGQEGSLLLWAWLVAVVSAMAAFAWRRDKGAGPAVVLGVLLAICGFFTSLLIFANDAEHHASPFTLQKSIARSLAEAQPDKSILLFGAVAEETHSTEGGQEKARFELRDGEDRTQSVSFAGKIPDGFRADMDVVAEGYLGDDGVFYADYLQIADGQGLRPVLQTWAMAVHPPPLFLGYAASTILLALVIGGLATGRLDGVWLARLRRWTLVTWLSLGIGIVLGSVWAYEEMSFGGYWAWDAVENASLLPWLTATALLHSLMAQQHRGMFKRSTAALAASTFLLCIVATYITRSGIVKSVHNFGETPISTFFLGLLLAGLILPIVMMAWGRKRLRSERPLGDPISRDGAFLAANLLLVVMTLAILVGTLYQAITGWLVEARSALAGVPVLKVFAHMLPTHPTIQDQKFYNHIVLPMAMVLAGLMAFGPFLGYGRRGVKRRALALIVPVVIGHAAMIVAAVGFGLHNGWALACVMVATLGVCVLIADFIRSLLARVRATGENPLAAAVRLFDSNHRRYGGQLAHLGMMMIVVGVAGSGLFVQDSGEPVPGDSEHGAMWKKSVTLVAGEPARFGPYSLALENWGNQDRDVNDQIVYPPDQAGESDKIEPPAKYRATVAFVKVTGPSGRTRLASPEFRNYRDLPNEGTSKVAILHNGLRGDLWLQLLGASKNPDGTGQQANFRVIIFPLVSWIWIGGIVLSAGGLFCLLPRFSRRRVDSDELANADAQLNPVPAPGPPADPGPPPRGRPGKTSQGSQGSQGRPTQDRPLTGKRTEKKR